MPASFLRFLFGALLASLLVSCNAGKQAGGGANWIQPVAPEFNEHWYDGRAEIARYELDQSRYGDQHQGEAVLIFVTEPFLKRAQVKADDPQASTAETVLKFNSTRTFTTGVYPYSTMTSAFTPVSSKRGLAVKVTTSIQEWCGHTFTQLNLKNQRYDSEVRSYFQSEGDTERQLQAAITEEGLFNLIRIDPKQLPLGETNIIPSQIFLRFTKARAKAQTAKATLSESTGSDLSPKPHQLYQVNYSDLDRSLSIAFEADFPHRILAWSEGSTIAKLAHVERIPYWSKNKPEHRKDREAMGFKH